MRVLIDITSMHKLTHQDIGEKLLIAIEKLNSCQIELSVIDRCLDELKQYLLSQGKSPIEAEREIVRLKKSLESAKIEIVEVNNFNLTKNKSENYNFRLGDFFSNLQLAYAKTHNYHGILTHNSNNFIHEELIIIELDKFIENHNYERRIYGKKTVIIDFNMNNITYRSALNNSNKKLISSLEDFSNYLKLEYIDPEYFFRVAQAVDLNIFINILKNEKFNSFGKKIVTNASNYQIALYCWQKNTAGKFHIHNDSVCATYVLSGLLTEVYINTNKEYNLYSSKKSDNVYQYETGSWNLVKLGTAHQLLNQNNELLILIVFKLFILDSLSNDCSGIPHFAKKKKRDF